MPLFQNVEHSGTEFHIYRLFYRALLSIIHNALLSFLRVVVKSLSMQIITFVFVLVVLYYSGVEVCLES